MTGVYTPSYCFYMNTTTSPNTIKSSKGRTLYWNGSGYETAKAQRERWAREAKKA